MDADLLEEIERLQNPFAAPPEEASPSTEQLDAELAALKAELGREGLDEQDEEEDEGGWDQSSSLLPAAPAPSPAKPGLPAYRQVPSRKLGESAFISVSSSSPGLGWCPSCCLSVAWLQPYFDVDTWTVASRMLVFLLPWRLRPFTTLHSFLESKLEEHVSSPSPSPLPPTAHGAFAVDEDPAKTLQRPDDAYGPFWLWVTLVSATAISSSVARGGGDANALLVAEQGLVLMALFLFLPPTGLYMLLGSREDLHFIHFFSSFGYAQVSFLPAVVLCMVPSGLLRWLVLLYSVLASVKAFLNLVADRAPDGKSLVAVIVVLSAEITLASFIGLVTRFSVSV